MKGLGRIFGVVAAGLALVARSYALEGNPVADPRAQVVEGNVRVTVLEPGLLRLEWAEDGRFEDRASLVFINRKTQVPAFEVVRTNGVLEVRTDKLAMKYRMGSGRFTTNNLSISFDTGGVEGTWHPGDRNRGNLLGTTRTLDKCNGSWHATHKKNIRLGQGIVSRDGWYLVDDSERPLFDHSDWPWVVARPDGERQDFYFFAYGHDYKRALADFTAVAGRIALPPKFVFGVWWSKYWNYNDEQLRDIVRQFSRYELELDVLVVDMDWHITSLPEWFSKDGKRLKDAAGQRAGWTGFTWNRNYFPDPEKFLKWTNQEGIRTCLNLHPASGVQPHEEQYPAFARAMGVDPATKKYIPFNIVDKTFAENYMKYLLHPMQKMGVDFWWLDWQQWSTTPIKGVNPTFYLNYVHFSDMERHGQARPLIFHRWGGLGNHRYQIGFSGDTLITWKSLAYQPWFTATAANVGFGFWSHDIGGHYFRYGFGDPENAELYTRWIQWGVLSPVFRTHATASARIERRPWAYPMKYFQAMRKAYDLRSRLVPYIYTTARQAYDTGVSPCRPLYYEWPELEEAYASSNEYLFGDSLLVNPVVAPMEKGSRVAIQETWLPPGDWIEYETGTLLSGPARIRRPFALDQIPLYVRAGAIVPTGPRMKRMSEKPADPLVLNIYPGASGKVSVYDDAGDDQRFKKGEFAFTDVDFRRENGKCAVAIHPVRGSFEGMPATRGYELRLVNTFPPDAVSVDGRAIPYSEDPAPDTWNYDGNELSTVIHLASRPVGRGIEVAIDENDADTAVLSGMKGRIRELLGEVEEAGRPSPPRYKFEPAVSAALTGRKMTYHPEQAVELASGFDAAYRQAKEILAKRRWKTMEAEKKAKTRKKKKAK